MKASQRILACSGLLFTLSACPGMGDLLKQYGFAEAQPASTLFSPGTIVWVHGTNPFVAGVVCSQREAFQAGLETIETPAPTGFLGHTTQADIPLDVNYQDQIKADARFQVIQNIAIHLENATVVTTSEAALTDAAGHTSPGCLAALAQHAQNKTPVTMISEALKADTTYTITWKTDSKLTVDAKIATLQDLAITLAVDVPTLTETTVSGKGLFWGVKDDPTLIGVGTPSEPNAATSGHAARLLPAAGIVQLLTR
jgi:hypothetical protein